MNDSNQKPPTQPKKIYIILSSIIFGLNIIWAIVYLIKSFMYIDDLSFLIVTLIIAIIGLFISIKSFWEIKTLAVILISLFSLEIIYFIYLSTITNLIY